MLLLHGNPRSARAARRFARERVEAYAPVAEEHVDAVVLVVSELVTNAVRYGCGPAEVVRLVVDGDEQRTRVEVHDSGHGTPHVRREDSLDDHGRGLVILDQLCPATWGVIVTAAGKVVWAEVPRGARDAKPAESVAAILAREVGFRPRRTTPAQRAAAASERLREAAHGVGLTLHGLSVVEDGYRPPVIDLGWCNVHAAGVVAKALAAWGAPPVPPEHGS
ncbi:ATP-binding protein [Streptomyces sp. NPDC059816]|uniref:ATP-binding protein n=1 Tax=Streptomyces sp. NPDC059816 TaxID=3346960 RepID=UPI0036613961